MISTFTPIFFIEISFVSPPPPIAEVAAAEKLREEFLKESAGGMDYVISMDEVDKAYEKSVSSGRIMRRVFEGVTIRASLQSPLKDRIPDKSSINIDI